MNKIDKLIQPTTSSERIASLDFLRGVAVLGILFINIENFAYPDSFSPWKYGFETEMDRDTRFWVYFLTQGKFYNMFALLFGVGFYIFLERLEQKSLGLRAMDIYARRLLCLFIIGLLHAYLIWSGDVLYHYAICGLLLFPFRSLSVRGMVIAVFTLFLLQLIGPYELIERRKASYNSYLKAKAMPETKRTEEQNERVTYWDSRLSPKSPDTASVHIPKATYITGLKETYKQASAHKGMIYHQGLLFPSLMVMLIGILFYRAGIFKDYQVWKFYWPVTIGVLFVGFVVNYHRFYHWTYEYFQPVLNVWKAWLFAFPKQLLGVGYVLLFNGLYQKLFKRCRYVLISNVGKMALTNYLFQNMLMGFIFYGYGFARFNDYSRTELLVFVLAIWVLQLVFSWLWAQKFKQGPVEYVWKKMTYETFTNVKV